MIRIPKHKNYEIVVTEKSDGDFRDTRLSPEFLRPEKQDHGRLIHTIDETNIGTPFSHVDGVYTRLQGITIGCLSADCPIIIVMGEGEIMALHSGWRGTRERIVDMIARYCSTPLSDIFVWIGPHIRDYEVGLEFRDYFGIRYLEKRGEKYRLSLEQKIIDDLVDIGILEDHISTHGADTSTDLRYHSYRRDGDLGRCFIGVSRS